jgi:hypothetical protein
MRLMLNKIFTIMEPSYFIFMCSHITSIPNLFKRRHYNMVYFESFSLLYTFCWNCCNWKCIHIQFKFLILKTKCLVQNWACLKSYWLSFVICNVMRYLREHLAEKCSNIIIYLWIIIFKCNIMYYNIYLFALILNSAHEWNYNSDNLQPSIILKLKSIKKIT